MKLSVIQANSILVKSKLPAADYVVNPYIGCAFGCSYCYADFMGRFTGHADENWGDYLDVKENAVELFEKELSLLIKRVESGKEKGTDSKWPVIHFGSVTDPYQGIEQKYRIVRRCLEVLVDYDYQGEVSILTKSPLVTRDIDLLQRLKDPSVGFTITSTDDDISRTFEKAAPPASTRLKALKEVVGAGVNTFVFVGPLLPHFVHKKDNLDELFRNIKEAGNKDVFVEHLNISWNGWSRLREELGDKVKDFDVFYESQTDEYKERLNVIVYELVEKYDLNLLMGRVIDHKKDKKAS